MNLRKTAQIATYCGLFLLVLFLNSFDLAVTVTLSLYLAVNSKTYIKLFGFSLVLFMLGVIFRNFDISLRFISDLTLDSYVLLLTSVYIYAKSQKRITDFLRQTSLSGRKFLSSNNLVLLVGSIVLALLLLPILGPPAAVIAGYLSFSYFSKRFAGRYAYGVGLFFLLFCPFFIIAGKNSLSENFAIVSFYFLIIGTVQETIRLVRARAPFAFSLPKINFVSKILHFMHAIKLPKYSRQPTSQSGEEVFGNLENIYNKNFTTDETASKRLRPIMKFIIIAGITGLLSFTVTFFGIRNKFNISSINTVITSKAKKIRPVITVKPTAAPIISTPTVAELSTISAQLKVMVENGTEIYGLAASTAARLKNAGFQNVNTGNATRSDYKNWEITLKKDDPVLVNYIKKVLKLETLTVNKASESAKLDLVIIAGSKLP